MAVVPATGNCQMKLFKITLVVFGLSLALITQAHGPVTTQQQTVNSYLIEFEYNTIGNIAAGDFTTFDVRIENPKTLDTIPFDSVFIRIDKKDGPVILAGNLAQAQQIGGLGASMSGIMPDEGGYQADVSFNKGGQELAAATFNFNVDKPYSFGNQKSTKSNPLKAKIPYLLVLAAGVATGLIISKFML